MINKKHKNNFLVIYKSAWGRISTKEIAAFNLRSVVSKFEKIKPNATIQKVYLTNGMECGLVIIKSYMFKITIELL